MSILEAILLGGLEGITEFLPISSTGHLILASYLLGIPDSDFLKSFTIFIQLGAIVAMLAIYWRSFLSPTTIAKLLCGFIPTALIGLALYPYIKEYFLGNELVVVAALGVGGLLLIIFELLYSRHLKRNNGNEIPEQTFKDISYRQAFCIGLFQSLALIPGVSRSAATITGGLLLGLGRVAIVEFSFLLAVPTMTAATAYDILKSYDVFTASYIPLLSIGFITAFVVALFAIKFLLRFVKSHTFIAFGVYRILLAAFFLLLIL